MGMLGMSVNYCKVTGYLKPFGVPGLCEEAELIAQMFNKPQMFIKIPNIQFSTKAAFLQNHC